MNITEMMVERALDRWADTSDGEGGLHRMRGALEAAFAAVTVIPGTDVFAAAEKESEVMPPDSERIFNREPSTATSPGGAIAGASGRFQSAVDSVKLYERVHIELENGKNWTEIDNGMSAEAKGITYENWLAYMEHSFYYILRDVLHELLCPITPPAPSPDEVEREREILREAQARRIMPMIGPLLDAWDGLPNDMRSDIKEIHPSLSEWLDHIISAMEEETNEMLDTGLEPLDEIDQDALTELQQRADAFLGDKSRFKVIDPPPFFLPDEVERADKALEKAMLPWKTIREVLERAGFAIAAMNRAPQPSYDDGLRRAAAHLRDHAEWEEDDACAQLCTDMADEIVGLSTAPQPSINEDDLPTLAKTLGDIERAEASQPSINEEMLALLKRSRVYVESHARAFGIDSDKQLVADIDAIIAKAENAGKESGDAE